MAPLRSLVIDQSTTTCGFAVVVEDASTPISFGVFGRLLTHGIITTPAKAPMIDRLNVIRADVQSLITSYRPDELVCENTMFFRQRSGQANAAMAAVYALVQDMAKAAGMAFYSQNPATIKLRATGHGNATKQEMIAAVCHLWGMQPSQIRDDNHADALAGAYVWLYRADEVRRSHAQKQAQKGRKRPKSGATC